MPVGGVCRPAVRNLASAVIARHVVELGPPVRCGVTEITAVLPCGLRGMPACTGRWNGNRGSTPALACSIACGSLVPSGWCPVVLIPRPPAYASSSPAAQVPLAGRPGAR